MTPTREAEMARLEAGMRRTAREVAKAAVGGVLVAAAFIALALASPAGRAHADPQPALDRQLTERLVRALEAQARATERLVQATERCRR